MKKAAIALTLVALFVPAAMAQEPEPPNPLTGAKSVFINADIRTLRDIKVVLAKELPQLGFARKASEADVVLEIRNSLTPTRLDDRRPGQLVWRRTASGTSGGTDGTPVLQRDTAQTGARMVIQGTFGVAVRGDVTLVVHKGVPSPFFVTQFANELVKAYRSKH